MLFKERGSQLSSKINTSAYLYSRNQIEDFLLKLNRRMRRQLKRGGTGQDGLKMGYSYHHLQLMAVRCMVLLNLSHHQ